MLAYSKITSCYAVHEHMSLLAMTFSLIFSLEGTENNITYDEFKLFIYYPKAI